MMAEDGGSNTSPSGLTILIPGQQELLTRPEILQDPRLLANTDEFLLSLVHHKEKVGLKTT